jgi:hypothetical protein
MKISKRISTVYAWPAREGAPRREFRESNPSCAALKEHPNFPASLGHDLKTIQEESINPEAGIISPIVT